MREAHFSTKYNKTGERRRREQASGMASGQTLKVTNESGIKKRENMNDELNSFGGREKKHTQPKPFWQRYFWHISIAALAALLLVFASYTCSSPFPKAEDVLCQSGGNDNWSGWH